MKCMEAQQLMKPYVDGKLSDRQTEAFLEHVEDCRDCSEELELFLAVHYTLDQPPESPNWRIPGVQEHVEQVRAAIHRRKLRRAAIAILVLLLISLICALIYVNLIMAPDGEGQSENTGVAAQTEAVSELTSDGAGEPVSEPDGAQQPGAAPARTAGADGSPKPGPEGDPIPPAGS